MSHLVFVGWKSSTARLFEVAKNMGHHVTLIRSRVMESKQNIDLSQTVYKKFIDKCLTIDDAECIDLLEECIQLIHSKIKIDGFIATVDAFILPVSIIAERTKVQFTSSYGVYLAKHKNLAREILKDNQLENTLFEKVKNIRQAESFAAKTGYPVVLKPLYGSASEGATIILDQKSLMKFFNTNIHEESCYEKGILMEEYLQGEFVSAEVALVNNNVTIFAISDRKTWQYNEVLEIGATIPASLTNNAVIDIHQYVKKLLTVIPLNMGVFHIELRLTSSGPRLIEINPRLMGASYDGKLCTV